MIVDSHVYCFPPIDSAAGHASSEEHIRWVQASHARHHQPSWSIRDRRPAPSQLIGCPGRYDLATLPNVRFRADHQRGRVVWTVEGEDYSKHFFPPNLRDLEFTTHSLIGEMDYAQVDVALIHTDPMLGRDSDFLAQCVGEYPDRLRSMAPVDEWRIGTDTDGVIAELDAALSGHGLHAVKFNAPFAYINSNEPWDDGDYRPFWEHATSHHVPIFFTLGIGPAEMAGAVDPFEARQGYLNELKVLMRWMERYPDAVCSLTHGYPWRLYLADDQLVLPEAIWEPFENPRCHLEVCFPVRLGDLFAFPYSQVWPTLEQMVERVGADHLLWGTDMPFQNRFCTYRQSRDWIEKHCGFLQGQDLDLIMGGTCARLLGLRSPLPLGEG